MEEIIIDDIRYNSLTYHELFSLFDEWIRKKSSNQVCVSNVHTSMIAQEDKVYRQILEEAALNTIDGQPLIWVAKLIGYKEVQRIAGPDLFIKVCENSYSRKYRHFFYGGASDVPEKLKRAIEKEFRGIQIVGTYSPPFRTLTDVEEDEVVRMINHAKPDFLWVGLGAPKQDIFIYEHLDRINVPVQIGIGAAFEFYSGGINRAPVWIQKAGFEWLHRLMLEPRRLWRRYLIYNTKFILKIFPEIIKKRS